MAKNGNTITSVKQWEKIRRPEIQALVETEMYGKVPGELIANADARRDQLIWTGHHGAPGTPLL